MQGDSKILRHILRGDRDNTLQKIVFVWETRVAVHLFNQKYRVLLLVIDKGNAINFETVTNRADPEMLLLNCL